MTPTHALSIRQPWLALIVLLLKAYEFRSWALPERFVGQDLVLHASAVAEKHWRDMLDLYSIPVEKMHLGAACAIARFGKPIRFRVDDVWDGDPFLDFPDSPGITNATAFEIRYTEGCPNEPYSGPWYAWPLEDVRPLQPVRCSGALKVWELPDDVRRAITAQCRCRLDLPEPSSAAADVSLPIAV